MKKALVSAIAVLVFWGFVLPAVAGGPLSGRKILMIIAPEDFQDHEYGVARKAFEEAGAAVVAASTRKGTAKGMEGAKVQVAKTLAEVKSVDFEAVVFIGGPGSTVFWDDPAAHAIAREAAAKKKVLGAICLAPVALARAGVLKGKNATVWPDSADDLKKMGARYVSKAVVTDGRIVTGNGPDAAAAFAGAIVGLLRQGLP